MPTRDTDDFEYTDPDGRAVPFQREIALRRLPADEEGVHYQLEVAERHLRSGGILHGGVTATMLDTTMGAASRTTAPPRHDVVTVQLNVNYLAPVRPGDVVTSAATVRHAGRKTAVVSGEMRIGDGTLVAVGSGTFMYLPPE